VYLANIGYSIDNKRRKRQGMPVSKAEGTANKRSCFLLYSKEAIRGWRHVRRAARDSMDDVPAAFFVAGGKVIDRKSLIIEATHVTKGYTVSIDQHH